MLQMLGEVSLLGLKKRYSGIPELGIANPSPQITSSAPSLACIGRSNAHDDDERERVPFLAFPSYVSWASYDKATLLTHLDLHASRQKRRDVTRSRTQSARLKRRMGNL